MLGSVKWFNDAKGYGFLAPDQGGKDVFVHVSSLNKSGLSTLKEGQRVVFETRESKKGIEAADVRPI